MLANKVRLWTGLVAASILTTWLLISPVVPQTQPAVQPNDTIQTIRIELAVGAGGEDLDEPVALDFGLGFPLWLHQLGHVEGHTVPFGAVSQVGTDRHAITAGQRATFEFNVAGPAGMDDLRSVPQLLADVHISDISRIAFTSKADHGWILAGYSIDINGRPFFRNDAVNANGRGLQDQARERLMELNGQANPEQSELFELRALVATELATPADRQRLAELEKSLASQLSEVQRLERQLRGAAPLFSDDSFQPTWRSDKTIEKVKVVVVTAPHTAASTRNFVYFRTGGHKYLLGSALQPLAPEYGAQEFQLNLTAAPLTASDLRGYALGVLAPHESMDDTPDRWHPQRLRVEVDDRVVYDSEDQNLDRSSLSAIRLIPPAHLNRAGQVVTNTPNSRETSVWESGSGAGLDLVQGGVDALPELSDPTYPQPESNVFIDQDVELAQPQEPWYDPIAEPFPGEFAFQMSWQQGWEQGWQPGWQFGGPWQPGPWQPGGGWMPDWGGGWNDGWGSGCDVDPGWLGLLLAEILNSHDALPEGVIPDPVGEPPQLEHVSVNYSTLTIQWTTAGDESQIDHFVVDRLLMRPDADVPIVEVLGSPLTVPAAQRSLPLSELEPLMPVWTDDEATRFYIAYRVTMVPTDPALGVDPGLAPAAPVRAMNPLANFHILDEFEFTPSGGVSQHLPLSTAGQPELPGPAAWISGQLVTHNGIDIAGLFPLHHHIVARAQTSGDQTTIQALGLLPPGHHRFIAYCGFVGAVQQHVAAQVSSAVHVQSVTDPTLQIGFPAGVVNIDADPMLAPSPLVPVVHDIDTSMVGPGMMSFRATYTFHHTAVDPQHPPALIGLRLLGM